MSDEIMKFKQRYLVGEIAFEEIDHYVEEWNKSNTDERLAVFLGLNEEEENCWIDESDEALMELLDKQKK